MAGHPELGVAFTTMPGEVPKPENALSTADMRAYLQQRQAAIEGRALRFTETRYTKKAPPEQAHAEGHKYEATWLSVRAGRSYRLERAVRSVRRDSPMVRESPVVMTWDGTEARSKADRPDGWRGFGGVINATPPFCHYVNLVLTWQGWWIFQQEEQSSFADWLPRLTAGELSADGDTIWRAAVPKRTDAEIRIAARRVDGEIRLTWAEFNAFQSNELQRRLVARCRIEFGPPSAQLGNFLSASAAIHVNHYTAEWESWQLTCIELVSVDACAIDDATFRVGFEPGTRVHDRRINVEGGEGTGADPTRA